MTADINTELRALEALKEALGDELRADPDFLLDVAEGETGLLELIDAMLLGDLNDEGLIAGIKTALDSLNDRLRRVIERKSRRRVLIERALLMLERKKLERPCATVSVAQRPRRMLITDESLIPSKFFREVRDTVLDKAALDAALRAEGSDPIPGASLDNGSVSLTVRRK